MKYIFVESVIRLIQILFGAEIFEFPVLSTVRNFFHRLVFDIGKNPTIGRNDNRKKVWVGARAILLPTINHIGENSIIGAGSVVTDDIPPNVIAAGNPAKIIKKVAL